MGEIRDPERDQSLPVPSDAPYCHDMVITDMEERKAYGKFKYGVALQPFNGRSMLQDAYEEVLDLAVYLRGLIYEESKKNLEIKENENG